jgi:hypothetical protein
MLTLDIGNGIVEAVAIVVLGYLVREWWRFRSGRVR